MPSTAAFIEAHATLTSSPTDLSSDAALLRHEELTSAAWSAWRTATAHAERVGLNGMSREERKRVTQAQALLRLATDSSATEHERSSAYSRVRALLDGLLPVPAQSYAAIESSMRTAITA